LNPRGLGAGVTIAPMQIVALYNLKGGVGKTAGAVNLAWFAARDGLRTLLWDLDPQAAATFYLRVEAKIDGGKKALFKKKGGALRRQIHATDFPRLDLVPGDFSFRTLDVALDDLKKPAARLSSWLEPLADDYDLVLLDCPPSLSRTSESVFAAATALLVPLIPTTLSQRTLGQLTEHLDKKGPKRLAVWPFFCMVDRRKRLHRDLLAEAAAQQGIYADLPALRTAIPAASAVERMGVERAPLPAFQPASPASMAYGELWTEVRARLADLPS
jgi:chromosome partitioning protein